MDSVPPPAPVYPSNTPYQSHAAPTFTPAPIAPAYTPPAFAAAKTPERPQFAQFDASSGKPVSDDALPPMPSWNEAASKKIEVEEIVEPEKPGDLEMNRLDNDYNAGAAGYGAMHAPGRSPGRSPLRQSPSQDSYGLSGYQQNGSYASIPQRGPRSPSPYGGQYGQQQEGYRGVSPVHAHNTSAAAAPYAQNRQYGRSSPSPLYNQPYGQSQGRSLTSPVADHSYIPPAGQAVEMPSPSVQEFPAGAGGPPRSNSPAYAPSGSTRYEAPSSAYPGQQTYQAFQPAAELDSGGWQGGQQRKPVNGTWKDL